MISDQAWEFWMPWIPLDLDNLLNSPLFMPRPAPLSISHLILGNNISDNFREELFEILVKSIIYQVILALDYLHGLPHPIAHRDIKPRNILLTHSGCVQLIDFGVSWSDYIPSGDSVESRPLWPEPVTEMKLDVATG